MYRSAKKLEPVGYSREQAWQDIRGWRVGLDRSVLPSWEVMDRAEQLMGRYSLSYWDAMIVAACLEAGITRLYSEDFSGYIRIDGLEVMNPFSLAE